MDSFRISVTHNVNRNGADERLPQAGLQEWLDWRRNWMAGHARRPEPHRHTYDETLAKNVCSPPSRPSSLLHALNACLRSTRT